MSHVFLAQGDILRLACHAVLLPGNGDEGRPGISDQWLRDERLRARFDSSGKLIHARPVGASRRLWTLGPVMGSDTSTYLVNSGGVATTSVDWYVDGLDAFLRALRDSPPTAANPQRSRPLVAVPMLGTGAGGRHHDRGGLIAALYRRLLSEAEHGEVDWDFVLVAHRPDDFSAAQAARRDEARTRCSVWASLAPQLVPTAERLALLASRGELVLFLGAGVSIGAGNPDWETLLGGLAADVGLEDALAEFEKLDVLDRAQVVRQHAQNRGEDFAALVLNRLPAARHSLSHLLLAGLPVREVATTNYDRLFEQASAAAGEPVAVLPYAPDASRRRWVLKLHGDVDHRDDIVLTREDYLSYGARRGALAGIVQGLLVTRHMLFVGFSLADDNFHRIVHEVRNALGQGRRLGRRFGTTLSFDDSPLKKRLWEDDLEFVPLGPAPSDQLELLLDRVLHEATDATAHLLDPAFADVLTDDDTRLKDSLLGLAEALRRDGGHSGSAASAAVRRLLTELGLPADDLAHRRRLGTSEPSSVRRPSPRMRFENRMGEVLETLEDWRRLAPPASPELHWREGRSAYELARDWLEGDAVGRVTDLLASASGLGDFRPAVAIAERKTQFDEIPGGPRNHDLLVLGAAGCGDVVLGIEGKADETFDVDLAAYRVKALRRTASTRAPERLDRLTRAFFGATVDERPELASLGYQLLSALAGTLAEASAAAATRAVLLIHEFVTPQTDDRKHEANAQQLAAFTRLLGAARVPGGSAEAWITEPVHVRGNADLPPTIPIHVAKLVTRRR